MNFQKFIEHRANLDLAGNPRYGKNPDIFFTASQMPDQFGLYLFHLCFTGESMCMLLLPQRRRAAA